MEVTEFYRSVGKRIRQARLDVKLTQEQLAAQVSLTRTSISNIERGDQHLHVHTLWEIARVLSVEAARLLPPPQREAKEVGRSLPTSLSRHERNWIIEAVERVARTEDADINEVSEGGGKQRGHSPTVD